MQGGFMVRHKILKFETKGKKTEYINIKDDVMQLKKWKILSDKPDEDKRVLEYIRSRMPEPAISVCYMVLSEQCNLACKYCFLGNNDSEKRKHFNFIYIKR